MSILAKQLLRSESYNMSYLIKLDIVLLPWLNTEHWWVGSGLCVVKLYGRLQLQTLRTRAHARSQTRRTSE